MRKIIAATMMLIATPASADRFAVVSTDPKAGTMVAIDLDTIRVVDGYTRAWTLATLMVSGKQTYAHTLQEYDCKQERSRVITNVIYHIDGSPFGKIDPETWAYPAPDTPGAEVLLYGCGKKTATDDRIIQGKALEVAQGFFESLETRKSKR